MRICNVIMLFSIFGYHVVCFGDGTKKASWPRPLRWFVGTVMPSMTTVAALVAHDHWIHWYNEVCEKGKFSWKRFKYDNAQDHFKLSLFWSAVSAAGIGLSYYIHTKLFPEDDTKLQREKAKTKKI
jgi:hypothetical protein